MASSTLCTVLRSSLYKTPEWAACLQNIPSSRLKIAQLPTPIHEWKLPDIPDGYKVFIKRDDLTGASLSGNKVRKLEFIFAEALTRGCKHVITCGGIQSNHCRATAALAAELGLKCHLFLRGDIKDTDDASFDGNMFINRVCGADIYFVPRNSPYERTLLPRMKRLADKIKQDTNETSYLMPVGGSDAIGVYGYIEAYRELMEQGALDDVTDIVFTCGSGGTGEGLAAANYLATNCKLKIHGFCVSDDAAYFHNHADGIFKEIGLNVRSHDILSIVEGHKGAGYGIAHEDDYRFIMDTARSTGIILDATYTAKAVRGLIKELRENQNRFNGSRILFIHTGGIFGAMDGSMKHCLKMHQSGKHYMWNSIEDQPWG